jgi:predicted MFS family arabinose efflux permease
VILGFLTFLAPALEARGHSSAVAGLVVAVYGLATVGGAQVVKRLVGRVSPTAFLIGGGGALVGAYLVAALTQDIPGIFTASVLIGIAFSSFHSTVQTWATELAPEARGTATSLFVTAVFTGAALATFGAGGLAAAGRFGVLFLVAVAIALPVVVIGAIARSRYRIARPGST